jgi:5'-methylthioadenosine phosphorylase
MMSSDLAIVGGTSLIGSGFFAGADLRQVRVGKATVAVYGQPGAWFLPRHGVGRHVPPHLIDHAANLSALRQLGVRRILAVSSVGSLRREITPAQYVVPDDFISLWCAPATGVTEGAVHATPVLDAGLRQVLCRAVRRRRLKVVPRGVYAQTTGPRLETAAEIRFLAGFADVVGMTMASEAAVAGELGLSYAALCVVDNFANGIVAEPLTLAAIQASARRKVAQVIGILGVAMELLPS